MPMDAAGAVFKTGPLPVPPPAPALMLLVEPGAPNVPDDESEMPVTEFGPGPAAVLEGNAFVESGVPATGMGLPRDEPTVDRTVPAELGVPVFEADEVGACETLMGVVDPPLGPLPVFRPETFTVAGT